MEAMASLGRCSGQLGSSFLPPCNTRVPISSRDFACAQTKSTTSVTGLSFSAENQQHRRVAVLKNGAKGMKRDVFDLRGNLAVSFSRQLDAEDTAERPKLVARFPITVNKNRCFYHICNCQRTDQETNSGEDTTDQSPESWGIQIAIAALKFYKSEISPLLPGSCRYVPTCSEYSMQAYRTYGVVKGTILTACRLARCNPLGGSGFDPPRWFGEPKPPSV
ncbi:unnamed protein product [Calypogeia fissa]